MKDLNVLQEQVKNCSLCRLCKTATQAVFGEGSFKAEIMFIGEAPGREEDRQGRPFVGAAGKFLNEMLAIIGLKREDVFITNIVKHRPPENRDPLPDEIAACLPYLEQQVLIIKPKLIVTLGRHAMNTFLPGLKISEVHGQAKRARGIFKEKQIYFPLYHPASALYNPSLRETLIRDMKKIPLLLRKIRENE
jgi:uracil-DNA glycosylase family 4